MLDLVLTHGLSVNNLEILDAVFSDHMPVIFDINLPCVMTKSCCAPVRQCRVVNPSTAARFAEAFAVKFKQSSHTDAEALSSSFHSVCQNVIDFVAPIKTKPIKLK